MSNFKVGEKVVYIMFYKPIGMFLPKKNEIVEIAGVCPIHKDSYFLKGYEKNEFRQQTFHADDLRKLDHQFSEDVIAEIIKQVKEESLTLAN